MWKDGDWESCYQDRVSGLGKQGTRRMEKMVRRTSRILITGIRTDKSGFRDLGDLPLIYSKCF